MLLTLYVLGTLRAIISVSNFVQTVGIVYIKIKNNFLGVILQKRGLTFKVFQKYFLRIYTNLHSFTFFSKFCENKSNCFLSSAFYRNTYGNTFCETPSVAQGTLEKILK